MNSTLLLSGAAGNIEVWLDAPAESPRGIALIGHPHPLMGGNANHKVPVTIARVLQSMGYLVARPNFRGVGQSSGSHDHGNGETDDMMEVLRWLRSEYPNLPLVLAGFSFGTWVVTRVQERLHAQGIEVQTIMLTGTAVGEVDSGRIYNTPHPQGSTLIVHGEKDEIVPLNSVFDWAADQDRPVVVIAGADHFFNRKLHILKRIVTDHMTLVLNAG
ncbi:alpha/beta hydrolase [Parathalassolituus penaei]|uniref:Alpha/beta fold hydrolase n=1 Tax=Parathalassolituus penaei TaxID=2997323 RepID=A0A9X3EFK2_9GAMM|nr:alpha/beta fold hydrolase [Parathalassolituus penaei]MCY0966647.1 alpha/beta fold hydrolase [Parathalassolituus penaei]